MAWKAVCVRKRSAACPWGGSRPARSLRPVQRSWCTRASGPPRAPRPTASSRGAGHGRPEAAAAEKGAGVGQPDHDPHFQGRVRAGGVGSKGRALRAVRRLPICNWSGELGPKLTEGDRQSPEGLLFHRCAAIASVGALAAVARHRLSQHLRQGARAYRLLHPGARRLHVDGLLRHDQRRDGGDLRAQRGRADARAGPHPGARVSVSHDAEESGGTRAAARGAASGPT